MVESALLGEKWVDKLRANAQQLFTVHTQVGSEKAELESVLAQKEELFRLVLSRQTEEQAELQELRRKQFESEARLPAEAATPEADATATKRELLSEAPLVCADLDALVSISPWVDKLRADAEQLRTAHSQVASEYAELQSALAQKEELLREGLRRQTKEQAELEELRRKQFDREARLQEMQVQEMQVQAQMQSVEEGLRTAQDKFTDQGFSVASIAPEVCVAVGLARCWRRGGLTHAGVAAMTSFCRETPPG